MRTQLAVRLAVVGCLGLSGLTGGAGHAAPKCSVAGAITPLKNGWSSIKLPAFPAGNGANLYTAQQDDSGGGRLRAYAVHPSQPNVVLVTDGVTVHRTRDGGCTWQQVFEVPGPPTTEVRYNGLTRSITDIVFAPTGTHPRVYLTISSGFAPGVSSVQASDDGGATWQDSSSGLPEISQQWASFDPVLSVAPSDPRVVYVLGHPASGSNPALYRSGDSGRRWTLAGSLPTRPNGIAVNPSVTSDMWAWNFSDVWRSRDAGKTWVKQLRGPDKRTGSAGIVLIPVKGRPARIVLAPGGFCDQKPWIEQSDDDGRTWRSIPAPICPERLVGSGGAVLASDTQTDKGDSLAGEGLIRYLPGAASPWRDHTPYLQPTDGKHQAAWRSGTAHISSTKPLTIWVATRIQEVTAQAGPWASRCGNLGTLCTASTSTLQRWSAS